MDIILNIILVFGVLIILTAYSFGNDDCDYLILFGSGLNKNKETLTLTKRVNRAALYLSRNMDCKVVVTGGITGNNTISEAQVMKQMLIDRHIHQSRIIVEDKATNTKENVAFSKALIDTNKKIVVCSSDYHILRIKLLMAKAGISVKSICSQSSIIEMIFHLPIEEIFIIKDLLF